MDRLSSGDMKRDVELIFGDKNDGPGIEYIVNRDSILSAVDNALPSANGLPSGFQMRVG
jgi:hypothetical protein